MGEWNQVGESNWRLEDGAVVADKRTSKEAAHLLTKTSYKDFQIYVSSGRAMMPTAASTCAAKTSPRLLQHCYEANIFDQRKDPTYGTGGIVNFAEVNPMPKAGGKWNTFEITVKGRLITVVLNGTKTVEASQRSVRRRAVHAAARQGRDQVPQGGDQAAVGSDIRGLAS